MGRRITKARAKFISLVPRGANQMPVLYKSEDATAAFDMLTKAGADFADKGELLAVVYAPESRDSQGDIASAEVIKDMAYNAMKDGFALDMKHNGVALTKDQAHTVESFIVQKNDPRFADFKDYSNKPVDVTGAWAVVIKIDDPNLRTLYKDGKWNGVSLLGPATVEVNKGDEPEGAVASLLTKILNTLGIKKTEPTGDINMTAAELAKAIADNNTTLAKSITDGITAVFTTAGLIKAAPDKNTPADDKAKAAPVFKGDPTNPADIRKHATLLKTHALSATVDFNDPVALEKHLALVEEMAKAAEAPSVSDEEAGIVKSDTPEVRVLKKQLATLQKQSKQPTKTGEQQPNMHGLSGHFVNVEKAEEHAAAASNMLAFLGQSPKKQTA